MGGEMSYEVGENPAVVPFLRWAGGKRWLVQSGFQILPKKFNTYIEPFLGSGAVFFHFQPEKARLSDSNARLIETYKAIQSDWKKVQEELDKQHNNHSYEYYYEERDRSRRKTHTKAGQFIYLNRTCWNGLYRVNKQGKFNVPKGTKSYVKLPTDDFKAIADALRLAILEVCDFKVAIDRAKEGDFIFADPPYTVNHNYNGFRQYNEKIFLWKNQEELCDALIRADKRGVKFTLTNANHKSIKSLYDDFCCEPIERFSILAGSSEKRKKTEELVIRNWS